MAIFTTQQSIGQYMVIKSRNHEEISLDTLSENITIHIGEQSHLRILISEANYHHAISIIATKGSQLEIIEKSSWSGSIQWNIDLIEPYAQVTYSTRLSDIQNSQHTISINHQASYTSSHIDSRYYVENSQKLKQHTIITIPEAITHCNASQSAEILLHTKRSHIDIIPELQVATDRSNASHGVSIHPFSEIDIFYLMTRGLSRELAQKSIVEGFLE